MNVIFYLLLLLPLSIFAADKKSDPFPAGTTVLRNEPYVSGDKPGSVPHSGRLLDLYVPPGTGPFPLIVWIHGGGWHGGDKEGGADLARRFLPAGFAVASIDYRLTKDHAPFPAQIEDCFAALIWLRQHADKYHIDPEHVGVVGHSAGAHLSALIATTGNTSKFFTNAPVSTSVQAAVMWAGPFDLGRERAHWPRTTFIWNPADPFCQTFFPGGAYDETFARWASPATYLHSNLPPMLIVHGGRDTLVPESQAAAFAQSAKAMGNDVTYRVDPLHGHDVMQPDAITEALAFFEKTLKRGATTNGAP